MIRGRVNNVGVSKNNRPPLVLSTHLWTEDNLKSFHKMKTYNFFSGCVYLHTFLVSTADIKLPHHRLNLRALPGFTPVFIVHLRPCFAQIHSGIQ